ncbi:MAG TPA: S41 family peptidase [Clostridiales bacterium]|jgi:carboxyl-terminal processing protease|nr:S41 family peptidase [Clostridiales bacterium]
MRKRFLTGFLSGLIGAMFLVIVAGATYLHVNDDLKKNGNPYEGVSAAEKDNDENEYTYDEIVEKLTVLKMLIDTYYLEEVNSENFATGIYKGFISSLDDPYSTYYTKEEYANLIESSSGVYHGIGAVVSQDVKTGIITIVKPYKGSPAYDAGLLPNDIIYKVEGEEVTGEDLTEVVSKIKGKEGTEVNITIYRDGVSEPMEFTIIRQKINIPTIEYEMLDDDIGYIQIVEFDDITISQFSRALRTLERKGMKSLIVDVRNNPGGLLNSVMEILDRLLPESLIVYTEDKNKQREEKHAKKPDQFNKPMVVLINGNSASASEIFAGALQDYNKATVVGTTSFGKGIVQSVIPLSDGTAVKLTISKYFTPKGRNIHGTGIVPDVEIDLDEELKQLITIPHDQDNQLQKAIEILKEQMK